MILIMIPMMVGLGTCILLKILATVAGSLVLGPWSLIVGPWFLVFGPLFLVLCRIFL